MQTRHQPAEWQGMTVYGRDGEKIGKVTDVYLDATSGRPEWMTVSTGLFGMRSTFVPIEGAEVQGDDELRVPYDKDRVKDAPNIDADHELSSGEEQELYAFYGLSYAAAAPRGRDVSGPTTDDAMTRSEEELRVGTARRESGRARLRKYVVTEEVTRTVPVRREEVRVEREPITEANRDRAMAGPDISEEEHEVVLHEEEPVVEKRAVPKERVRMKTDTVTDEETISESVRKERIEADEDPKRRRR